MMQYFTHYKIYNYQFRMQVWDTIFWDQTGKNKETLFSSSKILGPKLNTKNTFNFHQKYPQNFSDDSRLSRRLRFSRFNMQVSLRKRNWPLPFLPLFNPLQPLCLMSFLLLFFNGGCPLVKSKLNPTIAWAWPNLAQIVPLLLQH